MTDEEKRAKNAEKKRAWRAANRPKARAIALRFARSEKGQERRKEWRDSHSENIRAATARYKAKMTPEERKQVAQKHRDNPATKLKRKLKDAMKRAAERGLPYDETLIDDLLADCACCAIELDYQARGRGCRNRGPSIDRVVNASGYVRGNCAITCGRCNAIKSDATLDEILAIAAYMQRHIGK